ncbi:MAG: DUF4416 family protein [Spirochaetia bacterium]|jgi:hypothetical protein|nr:DUF4416 family protein [Spirochaetia bacterium]
MAEPKAYPSSQLLVGVLSNLDEAEEKTALARLVDLFGPIMKRTESRPFSYTSYYDAEMGGPPRRFFLLFEKLVDPSTLSALKLKTNAMEQEYAQKGLRRLNLDPGLLSLSSLILASAKNRSHRIPIGGSIYAEVTLIYKDGCFRPLPWTYADYASPEYLDWFKTCRQELRQRLRKQSTHFPL